MEPVMLQEIGGEVDAAAELPDPIASRGLPVERAGGAVVTAPDELPSAVLPVALRVLHVAIILNLAVQCCYGTFQIFWVLQPPGTFGPMFGHATEIPFELMMARRMYALESWVAFLGLAVYVGVTEILPRRTR